MKLLRFGGWGQVICTRLFILAQRFRRMSENNFDADDAMQLINPFQMQLVLGDNIHESCHPIAGDYSATVSNRLESEAPE
jgi:hypothetical protein